MIEKATSAASIHSMLRTLAAHQVEARGGVAGDAAAGLAATSSRPSFSSAVAQALEGVNTAQMKAQSVQQAYESGEPVPLTDVVMNMQKASLAFEATLQIRNKVLKAYDEILNMPV